MLGAPEYLTADAASPKSIRLAALLGFELAVIVKLLGLTSFEAVSTLERT